MIFIAYHMAKRFPSAFLNSKFLTPSTLTLAFAWRFKSTLLYLFEVEVMFEDKDHWVPKFASWLGHALYAELIILSSILATTFLNTVESLGMAFIFQQTVFGLTFLPWYDAEMPLKFVVEVLVYTTAIASCLGYVYHQSTFLDALITSAMGALLITGALDNFEVVGAAGKSFLFGTSLKETMDELSDFDKTTSGMDGVIPNNSTHEVLLFSVLFVFGVVFQCRHGIGYIIMWPWKVLHGL